MSISTLDQHSINTLVDTQLTVGPESTNFLSMHMSWSTLGDYRPTVDRALIEMLIECQSTVNRVLIGMLIECQSRCQLSVDHRLIEGIS